MAIRRISDEQSNSESRTSSIRQEFVRCMERNLPSAAILFDERIYLNQRILRMQNSGHKKPACAGLCEDHSPNYLSKAKIN